ncbi:MAG TPA: M20/M25/M40 family metallo-hydrolase [Bryobacteraceae bacterium]|nr:M20/M25/M40 family metallo-hydrolase [Bryobacteraceae bacterium]
MRFFLVLAVAWPAIAQPQLARDIFKELIEINTTDSAGDNTRAAEAVAARFRAAGFPARDIHVLAPAPRKGNVIVRYRGSGEAHGILFLGHLDVVEARRADWSFDPFQFREQDGYFYGRGAQDMKADDAILVTNFIRLKREGFRPARDLILALTADEEGGGFNGVTWLLENHRELINASYSINSDAGGGAIRNGRRQYMALEAAEKTYQSFRLEVTNRGGHSSLPRKDNAIYQLAEGLARLAKYDFPVRLNEVTRSYFEQMASIEHGQTAADMRAMVRNPHDIEAGGRLSTSPSYNAQLRTTCVATMLSGGHAENALPQIAAATVNCRLSPDDTPAQVEATLNEVLADPEIKVTPITRAIVSPVSPLNPRVLAAVTAATTAMWRGVPVLQFMEAGATDGRALRNAGINTYGVSGVFLDQNDIRAHGRDERIPVKSFDEALDFMYRVIKTLGKEE